MRNACRLGLSALIFSLLSGPALAADAGQELDVIQLPAQDLPNRKIGIGLDCDALVITWHGHYRTPCAGHEAPVDREIPVQDFDAEDQDPKSEQRRRTQLFY